MSVPKRQASAARSAGGGAAQEWTTAEVLAWLAEQGRVITPATWYSYVSRGQAPAPVRYIARTPVWDPAAVRRFQAETRRGRAVPDEAGQ